MSWNKNAGWGQALLNMVATQVPAFGNILIVFDPDDSDEKNYDVLKRVAGPDSDGQIRFYTSLESAYAAAESNNNDVILLDGNSTHVIADGIAWTKNRIHVIGMDGGGRFVQQGAKVQNTAGVATAYVIKNTGVRNSFRNIKFIQINTEATALTVWEEGGEGTYMENCSIIFGVADNLDQTNAYEVVFGGDSCTFRECFFGNDNLDTSVARAVMVMDVVTAGQECKNNVFKDCIWGILSDDADANFIRVLATTDVKYGSTFINPVFHASINQTSGGVILTDAVDSVSGLVEGDLFFINPAANCTNFSSAITDKLYVVGTTSTNSTSGIAVTPS